MISMNMTKSEKTTMIVEEVEMMDYNQKEKHELQDKSFNVIKWRFFVYYTRNFGIWYQIIHYMITYIWDIHRIFCYNIKYLSQFDYQMKIWDKSDYNNT